MQYLVLALYEPYTYGLAHLYYRIVLRILTRLFSLQEPRQTLTTQTDRHYLRHRRGNLNDARRMSLRLD